MKITLCGSIKFMDEMIRIRKDLEFQGHTVLMPIKADGVDYWEDDNSKRVIAKREMRLIEEHFNKIKDSDAILVVNVTKNEIENYIGANTFLEMGFAHYLGKKIYVLNPLPKQPYIKDELQTFITTILSGNIHQFA